MCFLLKQKSTTDRYEDQLVFSNKVINRSGQAREQKLFSYC